MYTHVQLVYYRDKCITGVIVYNLCTAGTKEYSRGCCIYTLVYSKEYCAHFCTAWVLQNKQQLLICTAEVNVYNLCTQENKVNSRAYCIHLCTGVVTVYTCVH